MKIREVINIAIICSAIVLLGACPADKATLGLTAQSPSRNANKIKKWSFSNFISVANSNIWTVMSKQFKLEPNPLPKNVQHEILSFVKQQDYLNELINNAEPYIYYIYQQTKKRHMPAEIALLPMIESDYNPFLHSHTGASGLWQLMPGTASGLGLNIDWWYDGRRDIITSTKAALDYLQYLHSYFGNWLLAIAAYDSGEGTVEEAILYNKRHHKPANFWSLPLPYETKNYVPKLLAIAEIIKHPTLYHVKIKPVRNKPFFIPVQMKGQISLLRVAKYADINVKMLRKLNPGFRRWATNPNGSYALLLPRDKADIFRLNLVSQQSYRVNWLHHKVIKGETLEILADKFHTDEDVLRTINHLQSNLVKAGEELLIPIPVDANSRDHKQKSYITEDRWPGPKKFVHTVKKHDTLERIAKTYHVTTAQIRYWNNLAYRDKLHFKQKIIIWKKPHYRYIAHFYTTYHVKAGDNLGNIAYYHNSKIPVIKTANHLKTDIIHPGQILKIPFHHNRKKVFHAKSNNELIVHLVHPGESLNSIAHYYRVSVADIKQWNHLKQHQLLQIGKPLRIYVVR